MTYAEKSLTCSDCGQSFTFTAGEQEFFATKGFTNEPRRCPQCRQARKTERNGNGIGGDGYRTQRQMFPATCAECGKNTQVPFEPRGDKPVYCLDCYNKVRVSV